MNHKPLFLTVALIALLVIAGAFWCIQNRPPMAVNQPVVKEAPIQAEQPTQTEGTEGIKDLIDGEYAFTPVDTSDWQTYRNEEVGFEVKIPKDWFCGGIALDPNSKRSIVCLEEKLIKDYYAGKFGNNDIVMINFPDLEEISTTSLKENLISAKQYGSKIFSLMIDKENAVLVIMSTHIINVSDGSSEWNIVAFPSVKKDVFDGLLRSFKFLR
ncbi:MAG: hypothetical protein WBO92_00830 [Candidatus Moraniibacteriota bacterium]